MQRRLATCTAVIAVGALGLVPAHAGTKPKHKPITGSYSVSLPPDPSTDAFSESGQKNPTGAQCGVSPASVDKHPFTVPAAGTLHVVLDSANPLPTTPPLLMDWDLHILDADGSELDASTSPAGHEETTDVFKKGQPLTLEVCNLTGQQAATVTYTFTFK